MLIGLISDTHDNAALVKKAAKEFKKRKIRAIIHSGDLVAPITLNWLKDFKIYFCLGNSDGDIIAIKEKIESFKGIFLGLGGSFTLDNKKFAVFHGHYPFILDSLVKSQKFDYVIHGHTHKKANKKIGKTRVINPGCLYRTHDNSIAVLDTKKDEVKFIELVDN